MPEQKRTTKSKTEEKKAVEEVAAPAKKTQEELDKLKLETDELLEAIDEALGEELLANAQEFVNSYQQKGGE